MMSIEQSRKGSLHASGQKEKPGCSIATPRQRKATNGLLHLDLGLLPGGHAI